MGHRGAAVSCIGGGDVTGSRHRRVAMFVVARRVNPMGRRAARTLRDFEGTGNPTQIGARSSVTLLRTRRDGRRPSLLRLLGPYAFRRGSEAWLLGGAPNQLLDEFLEGLGLRDRDESVLD